jgi:hypothetical protein
MEPHAAEVRAAPYNAIETRMYAATLPEPAVSSQPFWPPKLSSRAAGRIRVNTIVRRLRSIRVSSMPRTVRLKPPNGGTRRALGSMVCVVMPTLLGW